MIGRVWRPRRIPWFRKVPAQRVEACDSTRISPIGVCVIRGVVSGVAQ